jgi:Domain of unknown function (DUF4375)
MSDCDLLIVRAHFLSLKYMNTFAKLIVVYTASLTMSCAWSAESPVNPWLTSPLLRAAKTQNLTVTLDALTKQETDDTGDFLVWRLLCEKEERTGFDSFNQHERDAFVYFQMIRNVTRNGFSTYLENSSGRNAGYVLDALDRIGATDLKQVYAPIHKAIFGDKPAPTDRTRIDKMVERAMSGKQAERFSSLAYVAEGLIEKLPDTAQPLLAALVRKNPASFNYPLAYYEQFFEIGNVHLMFPEDRKFSLKGEGGRDDWRDATITVQKPGGKVSISARDVLSLSIHAVPVVAGHSGFEYVLKTTQNGDIRVPYFAKGGSHSDTPFLYELGFDNDPVSDRFSTLLTWKRINSIKNFSPINVPHRALPKKK